MNKRTKIEYVDDDELLMIYSVILCYKLNYTQRKAAQFLKISLGRVNEFLKKARSKGLIETRIKKIPQLQVRELGAQLITHFNKDIPKLKVIVVPSRKQDQEEIITRLVGIMAARHFENIIFDGCKISIDGGETVANTIEELEPRSFKNLQLFPIAGGPPYNPYTSIQALIGRFYGKFGARSKLIPHFLPPPMAKIEENAEAKKTLDKAKNADIFLLGIGAISKKNTSSTVKRIMEELKISLDVLIKKGVVGVAGYTAFDKEGNIVTSAFDDKIYKLSGDNIKKAARDKKKHVIILGGGINKVEPIKAMLKGGWGNCLITDQVTAEEVLKNFDSVQNA